jgi:integrase/recombinase XerC
VTLPGLVRCRVGQRPLLQGEIDQSQPRCRCRSPSQKRAVRGASAIIADIGRTAGLDEQTTATSFATTLIRGGTDLVVVAELLGHARLETVRAYTKPTEEDKTKALNLLPVDH